MMNIHRKFGIAAAVDGHASAAAFAAISAAHKIALALVWSTVAMGAIVFTEPAPFDVCARSACLCCFLHSDFCA